VVRRLGLSKRFVPYVVAGNWGMLIVIWLGLPIILLPLMSADAQGIAGVLGFGLFLLSLLFSWRLTQASLARDTGTTTTVFLGMAVASILTVITLQSLLGLNVPAA